jgi:two-component system nitrogen regulation response regulator NtrX
MQGDKLLVVDDESGIRNSLAGILGDEGWQVDLAASGEEALATLKERAYRAIFLDVWLPGIDGLETLRLIRRSGIDTPVVIISGHGTIETAVRATKLGAFDFVEKPLSLEKVLLTLRNALRQRKLEDQGRALREQMRRDTDLAGDSPAIRRLREEVERAARLHAPVLITGENGTGKELVARVLHARSPRSEESFIAIDCTAVPAEMIDAELFGESPRGDGAAAEAPFPAGAGRGEAAALPFTGRRGKILLAHEGTLFLDEIAGLPPAGQAKLHETVDRG